MILEGTTPEREIDQVLQLSWTLDVQEDVFGSVPYTSSNSSVAEECGTFLTAQNRSKSEVETKSSGLTIEGQKITELLLNQALDYFQKGLGNLGANYTLAKKGYKTWAGVTNYYSSYFSLHALLCLQGQTITRINIKGETAVCHVIALNLGDHRYSATSRGLKGREHKKAWNRYYAIYDRYNSPKRQFEVIHKASYVTDPSEESDFRNDINYSPFQGFVEIGDPNAMFSFMTMYDDKIKTCPVTDSFETYLDTLRALSTDPEFQYFARSILRLLFIADILKRIAAKNMAFKAEWEAKIQMWQTFMLTSVSPSPAKNYVEAFCDGLTLA